MFGGSCSGCGQVACRACLRPGETGPRECSDCRGVPRSLTADDIRRRLARERGGELPIKPPRFAIWLGIIGIGLLIGLLVMLLVIGFRRP
jgi:hypothetical protein